VAGEPVWQKERLPLVLEPEQPLLEPEPLSEPEQPEPLLEPAQELAVGAARQWFERAQSRHGIERRKPFR
jgi:hypothetical protein